MIEGTTTILFVGADVDVAHIDNAIFTLRGKNTIQKRFPEKISYSDGHFNIPLTQEDTIELGTGRVFIQGQINYTNKSVGKTEKSYFEMKSTLATDIVDGNTPDIGQGMSDIKLSMDGNVIIANVGGELSPEQIQQSLDSYLAQHPIEGVTQASMELYVASQIPSLEGYAKTSDIPTIPSFKTINGQTITGEGNITISGGGTSPDLSGYATESWVEGKGYLTEHQSLSEYAKKTELPTKTSDLINDSGFLTEHQALKTINGVSIIGSGNVEIVGGGDTNAFTSAQITMLENILYKVAYTDASAKTEVDTFIASLRNTVSSGGDTPSDDAPTTKTLTSISAVKTTTSYNVDDTLSTSDITVTAHYSDGTTATVSATIDSSSVNMSVASTYSISISYTESDVTKTTSISVTVNAVQTEEPTPSEPSGTLKLDNPEAISHTYVNGETYSDYSDGGTMTFDVGYKYIYTFDVELSDMHGLSLGIKNISSGSLVPIQNGHINGVDGSCWTQLSENKWHYDGTNYPCTVSAIKKNKAPLTWKYSTGGGTVTITNLKIYEVEA